MKEERDKVTAKAIKYKEQNEALQTAIKEHIQAQEDLRSKLKNEAKAMAGRLSSFLMSYSTTFVT